MDHDASSHSAPSDPNKARSASSEGDVQTRNVDSVNESQNASVLHATPSWEFQFPKSKRQRKDPGNILPQGECASTSLASHVIQANTNEEKRQKSNLGPILLTEQKKSANINDRSSESCEKMRWRQQLEEWHRKKRICCPHCQVPLVGYTTNISTVELIGMEANILRVFHTECQEKTKGKSFLSVWIVGQGLPTQERNSFPVIASV